MITILGALVGLIPHIFSYFKDVTDKKQELAIMQIQLSMMQANLNTQLQEVNINAQIADKQTMYNSIHTNIPFIDAINGLIRPLIAMIFTGKIVYAMIFPEQIMLAEHDYGIFSVILAFYFGGLTRFK